MYVDVQFYTLCSPLSVVFMYPSQSSVFSRTLLNLAIGCLIHSDLMFYLGLHFNSLRRRSLCLHGNDSPDCLGNSPLPACNESGQRLEQLNRRDNQSLIQTAMQNIQAIPSENVLSGILDFKLLLINLKGGGGRVWWTRTGWKETCGHTNLSAFPKRKKEWMLNIYSCHI